MGISAAIDNLWHLSEVVLGRATLVCHIVILSFCLDHPEAGISEVRYYFENYTTKTEKLAQF